MTKNDLEITILETTKNLSEIKIDSWFDRTFYYYPKIESIQTLVLNYLMTENKVEKIGFLKESLTIINDLLISVSGSFFTGLSEIEKSKIRENTLLLNTSIEKLLNFNEIEYKAINPNYEIEVRKKNNVWLYALLGIFISMIIYKKVFNNKQIKIA